MTQTELEAMGTRVSVAEGTVRLLQAALEWYAVKDTHEGIEYSPARDALERMGYSTFALRSLANTRKELSDNDLGARAIALLVEHEWDGSGGDDAAAVCPDCLAPKYPLDGKERVHHAGCEWALILQPRQHRP
jgi:hypothetical protein